MVEEILEALPFDRICEDMLDATLKGYAICEVVWMRDGNRILPARIKTHEQRRFRFDENWKPRPPTLSAMLDGIELPERKFIVHRFGVKGNNPYGLGLGTRLFWAVLFKREGVAFWLHFLEKFAGPTVVGKTPYGILTEDQRKLMRSLESVRTSSAITVPIGTDIEFLEATRSGSVTYEQWLAYWDRQISIRVTGETLTTQVGELGGNRAGRGPSGRCSTCWSTATAMRWPIRCASSCWNGSSATTCPALACRMSAASARRTKRPRPRPGRSRPVWRGDRQGDPRHRQGRGHLR